MVPFPSIVSLFLLIVEKRRARFTKDFSLKFLSLSRSTSSRSVHYARVQWIVLMEREKFDW